MDAKELTTVFFNHRHTGTHPDAKKIDLRAQLGTLAATAIVMISPNGSRYILGVDDDGALTTEPFRKNGSFFLVSPNGKKYVVGVESDGAATTELFSGGYGGYTFVTFLDLYDSVGTHFKMEVLDDGTISTQPV